MRKILKISVVKIKSSQTFLSNVQQQQKTNEYIQKIQEIMFKPIKKLVLL